MLLGIADNSNSCCLGTALLAGLLSMLQMSPHHLLCSSKFTVQVVVESSILQDCSIVFANYGAYK
jgi:hypothetical protein